MRIALLSDKGMTGGAALAATRLSEGLYLRGHHVGRFYGEDTNPPSLTSASELYPLRLATDWPQRFWTVLKIEAYRRYFQSRWTARAGKLLASFRPDVISVHNLHWAAWDTEMVEECLRHAPVVWTLHDMWALTGSCAYSFECRKFEAACDAGCPQRGVYPVLPASLIAGAHCRRRRLYAKARRLSLVAPSEWLAREARRVVLGGVPVQVIPYGLPTNVFKPIPSAQARSLLSLPDDGKPSILVAAASLDESRKGMDILATALGGLDPGGFRVLLLGSARRNPLPSGIEAHFLGTLLGDAILAIAYSASDLFIHPARADNLPLVVLEAMACGVPVVALPIGGLPELVIDGKTGWLARSADADALAEAIRLALRARPEWSDYARKCRKFTLESFNLDLQAVRYERLFEAIFEDRVIEDCDLDTPAKSPNAQNAAGK